MDYAAGQYRRVTSEAACSILLELSRMAGIRQEKADSGWFVTEQSQRFPVSRMWPEEMRQQVREQLASSAIAQRLPDGLACLPDITAAASGPLGFLLRMGLPRNNRQLARHLAQNLKWYLDPSAAAVPWHSLGWIVSLTSIAATYLLLAHWSQIFDWITSDPLNPVVSGLAATVALLGPLVVLLVGGIAIPVSQFLATKFDKVHAELLYYYLLAHYADC